MAQRPQPTNFLRGHIWVTDLEPTKGAEMQKERASVIVSSDGVTRLPIKLVVPLTKWQDSFASSPFHVQVDPDERNGLDQVDAADVVQARCVSHKRFARWIGIMSPDKMEEIAAAIAAVVEYA